MKTKFTQLVLLHKKKVDEIEMMLQKNAQAILVKQNEIDTLVQEFASLQSPTNGIYQNFLTFVHHKEEFRQLIDFKIQELALLKHERQNIEFEKAKYLDGLEIKKRLEQIKKQEMRDLDEISVMLYANHKEKQ